MMSAIVVLLATCNGGKYLAEQIKSLLRQSYSVDIIIKDDGSEDATVGIIEAYSKQYKNIHFCKDSMTFGTPQGTFNFLLRYAKSFEKYDYFMFCDQDDVWLEDKVQRSFDQMKILESTHNVGPMMVFSNLFIADENMKIQHHSMWESEKLDITIMKNLYKILALNVVTGSTIMINKKASEVVFPMPLNDVLHDHWIAVNIVKYGYYSYIEDPLTIYRQHQKNLVGSTSRGIKYFIRKILHLVRDIRSFKKKYSHFNFKISLVKVCFYKVVLNLKRIY